MMVADEELGGIFAALTPTTAVKTYLASGVRMNTSQEGTSLLRGLGDCNGMVNWSDTPSGLAWRREGFGHILTVRAEAPEGHDAIRALCECQNLDTGMIAEVVSSTVIAAPRDADGNATVAIDIQKLGEAAGLNPMGQKCDVDRWRVNQRVWNALVALSRIVVEGKRTTTYTERGTKGRRFIDVAVQSPVLWIKKALVRSQSSMVDILAEVDQDKLRPGETIEDLLRVPVAVVLELDAVWLRLTTDKDASQYLHGFGAIAAIPAGTTSSAWARGIGVKLSDLWRRNKDAALADARDVKDGKLPSRTPLVTRFEALTDFRPAISPLEDVLNSGDPKRAVKYWAQALDILVTRKVLAPYGDATSIARALEKIGKDGKPIDKRKGWQGPWLDTPMRFVPNLDGPIGAGIKQACGLESNILFTVEEDAGRGRPKRRTLYRIGGKHFLPHTDRKAS